MLSTKIEKLVDTINWFSIVLIGLVVTVPVKGSEGVYQSNKVTLNLKDVTIERFIDEVESSTNYRFVYKVKDVDISRRVTIKVKNKAVNKVLKAVFDRGEVDYNVLGYQVYLYKVKKEVAMQGWVNDNVAEVDVTGVVRDSSGNPLAGASVTVKGTNRGTVTDANGSFTIDVENDEVLLFSFVGFITKEVVYTGQQSVTVVLEDGRSLDELVVIGYGTTTKEKFNGAVSVIDTKKLNDYSSANFEQALSGNMAGVQISGNGKNPGENSVIQIRGINTLTSGGEPLLVVDGVPLTEGSSFSSINTNDIESVNILKDAASAAIYGSRATNGVILITTKKGARKEGVEVTYDTYIGFQNRIDNFKLVDAYDYAIFDSEARNNGYTSGGTGRSATDDNATRTANGVGKRALIQDFLQGYLNKEPGLTNTNWQDAVFRTALQQSHYLGVRGTKGGTDYSISSGYLNQDNIIIDSDYKRYTNSIKVNTQINDYIRVGINSNFSLVNSNPTGEAGWSNYGLGTKAQPDPAFSTILMQPYYPIYNSSGGFALGNQIDDNNDKWDGPISENTIAQTVLTDFFRRTIRVFGSTYLEIEPLKDLKFKSSLGGDYRGLIEEFFAPSNIGNYRTPIANNRAKAYERNAKRENFITESQVNYSKSIKEHQFDVLLGFSYQQESFYNTKVQSENFVDNNIRNIAGATDSSSTISRGKWALESYIGRLHYSYRDRYFISTSFRSDGSSRFGSNSKYGTFSSVSAGWVLSNEQFFPKDIFLSYAKLRLSYGQTGNNQIPNYGSLSLIGTHNYVNNNSLVGGSYISTAPNPNLSWETTSSLNIGVDLGIIKDRIYLTTEYFNSNTKGLLLDVRVPEQSGFSSSLQNIGELENSGLEFELNGNDFKVGMLNIGFNANLSTNNNKVLALGNGEKQIIENNGGMGFITKVGGSIAQFYAYDIIGVYKSQGEIDNSTITPLSGTEVGDYIVRDANNDGKITTDDRVELGDYNPDFNYGFGINLSIKGFDISAQFTGVEGRKVSDRMLFFTESESFFVPTQYYFDNYYSERNLNGFFGRPDFSTFSSARRLTRASSLSVYNADYFRLRSLQIGYNFNKSVTDFLKINDLRVYVTMNNIFNISDYRGYNADALDTRSNKRQTLTRGWIQSASPLTSLYAFGVNVKF